MRLIIEVDLEHVGGRECDRDSVAAAVLSFIEGETIMVGDGTDAPIDVLTFYYVTEAGLVEEDR